VTDGRTDRRTDGQIYDSQDRASTAASRGKNESNDTSYGLRVLPHQALADPTFPHGADCFPLKSIPPAVCYGSVVSSPSGSGAQPPNRFSCSLRYNRCNPWSVNYNFSKCVSSDWMATFWHRGDGPCLSRNPPVPSSESSHHWHVRVCPLNERSLSPFQ